MAEPQALLRATPPADADAAFSAGISALGTEFEEEAAALLALAAEAHPSDARLWQALGLLQRALDDLASSLASFERAAALAPANPLIAHSHARVALEAGAPALELFEHARALAPADGSVLLGRAAAQVAEGRVADAILGLRQILLASPQWIEGHQSLSRLRWRHGERDGFASSYEEALRVHPRQDELWQALIGTLIEAGRHEEALPAIDRARAAAAGAPLFDALEAVCTAEAGKVAKADALFARLGEVDFSVKLYFIRHLLRAGRPERALAAAEPLLAEDADNLLWPYLSIAWRLVGDRRWEWLEGDPRFVGVYDIGEDLPPLHRLAERLRSLHNAANEPLEQSVRGGTQTDGALFSRAEPEIRALRQAVVKAVERHVAQLPAPEPGHPLLSRRRGRIRFSGSWSVKLSGGGRHVNHIHPAGWLSSALYVTLPTEAERGAKEAGWLALGEPQSELGVDLPPFRTIEPKPGRLVLFPSTMWHGTLPFVQGERLTVAFDVARPLSF